MEARVDSDFFCCPDLCRFRLMPGSHTSHTTNVHHDFRHKTIRTIFQTHHPLESLSRRHHGLSLLPAVPPCWCNHCHPWWIGQAHMSHMSHEKLPTIASYRLRILPLLCSKSIKIPINKPATGYIKLTMKQRQASHQPPQRCPVTSTSGVPHGCQFHSKKCRMDTALYGYAWMMIRYGIWGLNVGKPIKTIVCGVKTWFLCGMVIQEWESIPIGKCHKSQHENG